MNARSPFRLLAAALFAGTSAASAQGLLNIQRGSDFKDLPPVTVSATAGAGYDSIQYNNSSFENVDSIFLQGNLGVNYAKQSEISPYLFALDGGVIQYLDNPNTDNETNYSGRARFNGTYNISPRLSLTNNFFLTYEVEPNFGIGSSTNRRNGQYFYGYNNFNVSYAWSERVSTVSSYTIDGIRYDNSTIGSQENRFSHLFSKQFKYALSERNKLVAEYRYRTTLYERSGADFRSHYALIGLDRAWSERSTMGVRGGAEFYSSERADNVSPYFEATLAHQVSEKTSVNGYAAFGYDGAELGNFASRYSYRAGASATHQVSERLRLNGGLNYVHSEFDGQDATNTNAVSENEINATAGIGYNITDSMAVNANYSYTLLASDNDLRDYDRNRIFLGLSASF
jgi:hypothetical protein